MRLKVFLVLLAMTRKKLMNETNTPKQINWYVCYNCSGNDYILTMNLSFIKIDVELTYYITLASIMSGSCFLGIRTHKGLTLLTA